MHRDAAMVGDRLEELIDGQLRPVCAAPPLLLSTQGEWAGFVLERDVCRDGSAGTIFYPHTSLVLVASGSIAVEDRALAGDKHFVGRCGSVTLWPAGYESTDISWTPECMANAATEMIRVQLNLSVLDRLAPDDDRIVRRSLVQQSGIDDPALASMMQLMGAEVASGCPAGRLFAESLCLALATHVAQRYGDATAAAQVFPGGLSRRQLELVRGHIEARLDGDLSLGELSALARLSPQHFAVAFRKSVGITPHQYVLRQRVEKAKFLLAARRASIAEVAATVGFASQSHFTEVFRRLVGTTPTRYRQAH